MSAAKKLPGPCFSSGLPNLSVREARRFKGLIDAARAELVGAASHARDAGVLAYIEGWIDGSIKQPKRVRP